MRMVMRGRPATGYSAWNNGLGSFRGDRCTIRDGVQGEPRLKLRTDSDTFNKLSLLRIGPFGLMDLVGLSLPSTAQQIEPRTIWLPVLVGTIVTVVAALIPARRATKVLPVEALREATPGSGKPSRLRGVIGFVLTGLGLTGR